MTSDCEMAVMPEEKAHVLRSCYSIPGMMWPVEPGWLYDQCRASHMHVEIGSYCGRSLYASVFGMESGNADCVEPLGDVLESLADYRSPFVGFEQLNLSAVVEYLQDATPIDVEWWMLDSLAAARRAMEQELKIDSLLIDANHNYAEVKADIDAWRTLVRSGGIITGHDYWTVHPGVMEAVNETFQGKHSVVDGTRIWWIRNEPSS